MPYEPYKGINIGGYTDGYSCDEYGNLYLISILGPDSAVKGLSSGIVSGKDIEIESEDTWLTLSAMRGEKYSILGTRLESGLLHQIVAMEGIFKMATTSRKLIYAGRDADFLVEGKTPDFSVSIQDSDSATTTNTPTALTLQSFSAHQETPFLREMAFLTVAILVFTGLFVWQRRRPNS